MTSKQKRKLKKEFMPKFYRNVSVWGAVALFAVLIIGIAVIVAVGMTYGENNGIMLVTIVAYVVALLISLIVILVLLVNAQKKLINLRTQEIVSEFYDLPFEEVTATLLEKRVITEHGFVANRGEYAGQMVVPFNEALVSVYSSNVYSKICTVIVITNLAGMVVAEYVLDNVLFNYICKKGVKLDFVADSKHLVSNKQEFVRVHVKGNGDQKTAMFLFGAIGAFISNENNGVNLSRKKVLDVLGKEMD